MQTWQAILVTLGILIVGLFLPPWFMFLAVFATSLWASIDSGKIQLARYKSGIALKPFMLFIACLLLWIVAFPWYLAARYRIKNGLAELK